jgi:FMN-dependent dehydrogenase
MRSPPRERHRVRCRLSRCYDIDDAERAIQPWWPPALPGYPPVELIQPVRELVGDRCAIAVDLGIRHGASALVALARGADPHMVGRAYHPGLAAAGRWPRRVTR